MNRINSLLRRPVALILAFSLAAAVLAAPSTATRPTTQPATRPTTQAATQPASKPSRAALTPEQQKELKLRELTRKAILALEARKFDVAEAALNEALVLEPDNYTNIYNMACLKSLKGNLDDAMAHLERACDAGFTDFLHIEQDSDLNNLRKLPRYLTLINSKDLYQKKDADRAIVTLRKQFGDKYLYELDPADKLVFVANTDPGTLTAVKKWLIAQAKSQWAELFANKPDQYIVVLLPSAADYRKLIRQPGVEGIYMPEVRTLIARRLGQVMTHEFTHAMHAGDLDRSAQEHPIWIIEGLASMYEAGQFEGEKLVPHDNFRLWYLQAAHRSARLIPLERLLKYQQPEFVKNANLAYGQASSVMLYLYETGLLKKFYETFKAGIEKDPTGKVAIETVSGKTLKEFEKDWQTWMSHRVPPAMNTGPEGPFLGVRFSQENDGLKIDEVVSNSPAAKAGIKTSDVIVGLNELDVRDQMSLMPLLKLHAPGEQVTLKVRRGTVYLDVPLTLGRRDGRMPATVPTTKPTTRPAPVPSKR